MTLYGKKFFVCILGSILSHDPLSTMSTLLGGFHTVVAKATKLLPLHSPSLKSRPTATNVHT